MKPTILDLRPSTQQTSPIGPVKCPMPELPFEGGTEHFALHMAVQLSQSWGIPLFGVSEQGRSPPTTSLTLQEANACHDGPKSHSTRIAGRGRTDPAHSNTSACKLTWLHPLKSLHNSAMCSLRREGEDQAAGRRKGQGPVSTVELPSVRACKQSVEQCFA